MAGCITEDYKNIILGLIEQETEKEVTMAVVKAIPLCSGAQIVSRTVPEAKRKVPSLWADPATGLAIEPVYYNAAGKKEVFSSVSALVREVGLPMSGTVCNPEGEKCRATSAVEILQVAGYTVRGNGEPKKGESHKLTVYHPESPQLKKLEG